MSKSETNDTEKCINEMLQDDTFREGLQPLVEFVKEFRKCKECGHDRGSLLAQCPYCGYEVIDTGKKRSTE